MKVKTNFERNNNNIMENENHHRPRKMVSHTEQKQQRRRRRRIVNDSKNEGLTKSITIQDLEDESDKNQNNYSKVKEGTVEKKKNKTSNRRNSLLRFSFVGDDLMLDYKVEDTLVTLLGNKVSHRRSSLVKPFTNADMMEYNYNLMASMTTEASGDCGQSREEEQDDGSSDSSDSTNSDTTSSDSSSSSNDDSSSDGSTSSSSGYSEISDDDESEENDAAIDKEAQDKKEVNHEVQASIDDNEISFEKSKHNNGRPGRRWDDYNGNLAQHKHNGNNTTESRNSGERRVVNRRATTNVSWGSRKGEGDSDVEAEIAQLIPRRRPARQRCPAKRSFSEPIMDTATARDKFEQRLREKMIMMESETKQSSSDKFEQRLREKMMTMESETEQSSSHYKAKSTKTNAEMGAQQHHNQLDSLERRIQAKVTSSDTKNMDRRKERKQNSNRAAAGKEGSGKEPSSKVQVREQLDQFERKIQSKIASNDNRGVTKKNNDRTRKKKELSKCNDSSSTAGSDKVMDMYEKRIQAKINAKEQHTSTQENDGETASVEFQRSELDKFEKRIRSKQEKMALSKEMSDETKISTSLGHITLEGTEDDTITAILEAKLVREMSVYDAVAIEPLKFKLFNPETMIDTTISMGSIFLIDGRDNCGNTRRKIDIRGLLQSRKELRVIFGWKKQHDEKEKGMWKSELQADRFIENCCRSSGGNVNELKRILSGFYKLREDLGWKEMSQHSFSSVAKSMMSDAKAEQKRDLSERMAEALLVNEPFKMMNPETMKEVTISMDSIFHCHEDSERRNTINVQALFQTRRDLRAIFGWKKDGKRKILEHAKKTCKGV